MVIERALGAAHSVKVPAWNAPPINWLIPLAV
jgi:hypothetical protein